MTDSRTARSHGAFIRFARNRTLSTVCHWRLQFSNEPRNTSTGAVCSHVAKSLDSLVTTRSKFIDNPLFQSDLRQLLRICEHWMLLCLTAEQRALTPSLSNDLQHLWNITDLLFNSSSTFLKSEDFSRYGSSQNRLFCQSVNQTSR